MRTSTLTVSTAALRTTEHRRSSSRECWTARFRLDAQPTFATATSALRPVSKGAPGKLLADLKTRDMVSQSLVVPTSKSSSHLQYSLSRPQRPATSVGSDALQRAR